MAYQRKKRLGVSVRNFADLAGVVNAGTTDWDGQKAYPLACSWPYGSTYAVRGWL